MCSAAREIGDSGGVVSLHLELNDCIRPPATTGSVFPFDLRCRGGGRGGRGERGDVAGSGSGDDSIRGVST